MGLSQTDTTCQGFRQNLATPVPQVIETGRIALLLKIANTLKTKYRTDWWLHPFVTTSYGG